MQHFQPIFCRILKNGRIHCYAVLGKINGADEIMFFRGADGVYATVGSDSPACSASSSAIARDVRSRSRIAAITPHTTARSKAIHENRVSQRSAAIPA